jgi:FAS-associated factor 2
LSLLTVIVLVLGVPSLLCLYVSVQSKEAEIATIRRSLPAEPPASGSAEPVTSLRITLPGGAKIQRRFHSSDTLQTLFDFVRLTLVDLGSTVERFEIGCNMPRRTFSLSNSDMSMDMRAAQLHPQAVVFVSPVA